MLLRVLERTETDVKRKIFIVYVKRALRNVVFSNSKNDGLAIRRNRHKTKFFCFLSTGIRGFQKCSSWVRIILSCVLGEVEEVVVRNVANCRFPPSWKACRAMSLESRNVESTCSSCLLWASISSSIRRGAFNFQVCFT